MSITAIYKLPDKPKCPVCGDCTVQILAVWKFEQQDSEHEYTGIYRCLNDDCDCYTVPSLPEVRA